MAEANPFAKYADDSNPFAKYAAVPVPAKEPPKAKPKPEESGYMEGLKSAAHEVAQDVREDLDPKARERGVLRSLVSSKPGGTLRLPKEASDVAATALAATGVPQLNEYVKRKTEMFPGKGGIDILGALSGLGPKGLAGDISGMGALRASGAVPTANPVIDSLSRKLAGPKADVMAKNVAAMDRLGIKPSSAVAHPEKDVRQLANTLGQNLFMGSPVRRAVRRAVQGVEDQTKTAAERLGTPKSAVDAGRMVKSGVERFTESTDAAAQQARAGLSPSAQDALASATKATKSNVVGFGKKANILYDRVERMVGNGEVAMPETQAAINDIRMRITDPQFIDFQTHPIITKLNAALTQQGGKMSFGGLRRLRSKIRTDLLADPALKPGIEDAEITNLYNAMSRDLSAGAEKLGGTGARKVFEQTDRYYRAGQDRIRTALNGVFDAETPNEVFHSLLQDAQEGKRGDLDRLMKVRRSLRPDEWRDFASSVLDQMGTARASQRTTEHETSFRTFLTNFEKLAGGDAARQRETSMADSGLKVLFEGSGHGDIYQDIKDIARVAGSLREYDKLYNHSNSGSLIQNSLSAGVGFGGAKAALTGHEGKALSVLIGALTGNGISWVLESPSVARYLASMARSAPDASVASALPRLKAASLADPKLIPLYALLREHERNNSPQANAEALSRQQAVDAEVTADSGDMAPTEP